MRLILLTIFQAVLVNNAPLKPRQACGFISTVKNIITVTVPAEVETVTSSVTAIDTVTADTGKATPSAIFAKISTSAVRPIVLVATATTSYGTAQVLPTPSVDNSGTLGTVITSLPTAGVVTVGPILSTSIAEPTSLIAAFVSVSSVASQVANEAMASSNIFQPVATGPPPSSISTRSDHPVPKLGIQPQNASLSTNKFYANFFLGTQTAPTWTHPYALAWAKGGGSSQSWGVSVSHIDGYQRVFGPDPVATPASYFINPNGIQSLILSAAELGGSTALTTDCLTAFSVNVNLLPSPGAVPAITFPLVQGMGFVTAIYHGGTPLLQTGVFFRTITRCSTSPKAGVTKYMILLEDGKTWLLYAYSLSGAGLDLKVVSNSLAQSTSSWDGIIQIAKNTGGPGEALYDAACGAYAISTTLSGSVNGATGTYNLSFAKGGLFNTQLVMFALPHHVQSFHPATNGSISQVQLQTTTKGLATAVVADSWTLVESNMPVNMGFAPWSPTNSSRSTLSPSAIAAIQSVAISEVSQDMSQQSDLNSFYFAGKVSTVRNITGI
jgi:endo-1,3(4)-beta-glucanase